MRLIDADAFKEYMRKALEETRGCYPDKGEWAEAITEQFCKDIDDQPTIEPQQTCEYWDSESKFCSLCRPSAQPERKKAKWIPDNNNYYEERYVCSACKHSFKVDVCMGKPMWQFCPNCGAKMEETK